MYVDDWDNGAYGTDTKPKSDYYGDITAFGQLKSNTNYKCAKPSNQKNVTIPKLSGLYYDNSQDILYATSCETHRENSDDMCQGGVYIVDINSNYAVHQTWAIPFKVGNIQDELTSYEDTESIAKMTDGRFVVCFESRQELATISGNIDEGNCSYEVIKKFTFTGKEPNTDDGLEGFDFYQDRYCLVINESAPIEIIMYDMTQKKEKFRQILTNLPEGSAITDLACLSSLGEVWLLDATTATIYRYQINGKQVTKVGEITMPNIIRKSIPDALVLDETHNCIYIGTSGKGQQTSISKIFTIKLAQLAEDNNEIDTYEYVLSVPQSALLLPTSSTSLPNINKSSINGIQASLKTIAYNGQTCQPVIKVNDEYLVMPVARQITGSTTFFYPEDLGYANGVLADTDVEFVGIKIYKQQDYYIATEGITITNPIDQQPLALYHVSYATRGLNVEEGDKFEITVNGGPISNDYELTEGTEVLVKAVAGGKRTVELRVNLQKVEPASGYTFTVTGNTLVKGTYRAWNRECIISQDVNAGLGDYVIYNGDVIIEDGDTVLSGTVITIKATEKRGYIPILIADGVEYKFSGDTYELTITGDTIIGLKYQKQGQVIYVCNVAGYNEEAGDYFSLQTSEGIVLATDGSEAEAFTGETIILQASTEVGRDLIILIDGQHIENQLVDDEYEFSVSGSRHSIDVQFGEPENPCKVLITTASDFPTSIGRVDTWSMSNLATSESLQESSYTFSKGTQLKIQVDTTKQYRKGFIYINGNEVDYQEAYNKYGGIYVLTLTEDTEIKLDFKTHAENVFKLKWVVVGYDTDLGDTLQARVTGQYIDLSTLDYNKKIWNNHILDENTEATVKGGSIKIDASVLPNRKWRIYVNDKQTTYDGTFYLPIKQDTVIRAEFSETDFLAISGMTNTKIVAPVSVINVQIDDLSGLAFGSSKETLYAVSNSTALTDHPQIEGAKESVGGVYELTLSSGTTITNASNPTHTWMIPGKVQNSGGTKSYEDTEAIAWHNNTIYLGFERLQQIVATKTNDYDVLGTIDFTGKGHDYTADYANDGIEGLAYLSGTTFFVGNQQNPVEVALYDIDPGVSAVTKSQIMDDAVSQTEKWQDTEGNELPFEIADLCYVQSLNELWVMNSNRAVIYRYDYKPNAEIDEKFLLYKGDIKLPLSGVTTTYRDGITTYKVNMANANSIAANNPEGLTIEQNMGYIYVGAEGVNGGTKPGKVYVFDVNDVIEAPVETGASQVNITFKLNGYSENLGDKCSVTCNGVELQPNVENQVDIDSEIIIQAEAGTNRVVSKSINDSTISLSPYHMMADEDGTIEITFGALSDYEVYMNQTQELYKLAQQVINGEV